MNLARLTLTTLLIATFAVAASCDSTATLFPQKVLFARAQIISAYPAVERADGSWARQCGVGPAQGLITNVAFISTQRKSSINDPGAEDKDLSIRPGDVIDTRTVEGGLPDDINLTNVGNLDLSMSCIDPQPSPDASNPNCQGAAPSLALESVTYAENAAERRAGNNVMVLIDQSGSIGGLVDENNGNREHDPDDQDISPPANFGQLASDRTNLRLAVTRRFIRILNEEDRYGIIAFNEAMRVDVPCSDALGDFTGDLDACFGKRNSDIWLSDAGLDSLAGQTAGRSNLWQAVELAYDYLKGLQDTTRSNHIIVITDGPDTCSGEGLGSCQSGCSTTDHMDVQAKITADINDPNAPKIHVHFVQFESLGYPGRDVRQVETSCVSGGHYQYINSNQFPRDQTAQLQEALETAVTNVRYSLMGNWQLAASVPAYESSAAPPTGTLPGSLYGLQGLLTVPTSSKMVRADQPFPFGKGQGEGADSATNWDRRPVVRKPCGAETDCGAAPGAGGACTIICSAETLTCPGNAAGVTAPDTFACTLNGGGQGFCCEGACEAIGGQCNACL